MTRVLQIAWAAGFLDGEGCFLTEPSGRAPRVKAAQLDRRPLDQLAGLFGGSVQPIPGRGRKRPSWEWVIVGNVRIASMLAELLPFLTAKKRQAEMLLFLAVIAPTHGRDAPAPIRQQQRDVALLLKRAKGDT